MEIKKLNEMFDVLKSRPKKRLVAAYAMDDHTICAVNDAVDNGLIDATLIGDPARIAEICKEEKIDINKFKIVEEKDDVKAAALACDLINRGEGDILMKGLLPTDKYMRAILNKERGLCPPNVTLAHVAVIQNPAYHKLLVASDCAIIPLPDLKQKQTILKYVTTVSKALGVKTPKVALVTATEQMSAGIPACVDAAIISKMAERGQIKGCLVEGPISLDLACDAETAQIKGMNSPVAGDADCLVFPNLEASNVFYKCCSKFNKSEIGAMLMGAKVPCVLSSRGDTSLTKLYSIALAALIA
ncbi:MAG: phosphate butyryltransferase [Bacteroidales bacterium]|jgi:phosphate butyryltransferase|nr:phosphate butyryltransferase [Bacteroidales bacterium]MBR6091280.1 phosphate butyryltransferase [Bacteroidales bacterium]